MAAWRSVYSEAACVFAREAVERCAPQGAPRARTLLWTCARLASWGEQIGLETHGDVLLHPSVLERYVVSGLSDLSLATRRTMRANLRYVARHGAPALAPTRPAVLRRDTLKPPYSDAQVAAYFELVAHQATAERVARLTGLLCLGLGAGLDASDMRLVRGSDVLTRSGGLVVVVRGRKARIVPVLGRHHDALGRSALFAAGGFVVGGDDEGRKNITSRLLATLDVGRLPRLEVPRLRATWLWCQIERLGLCALVHAAGMKSSSRLVEVAASGHAPSEEALVALLGGR